MQEAIDACNAAIAALRDSKEAMKGAKVTNLVQLKALVKAVAKLGKGAPKFQYQSNDIIATIEDLQATFKEMKKELDFTEHDVNSAFEKDRAEKQAISDSKTEAREAAASDKSDETEDRDADQNFLDDVTAKCEATAKLFDQRSSTRADELAALSKATQQLQDGAVPNF